MKRSGKISIVLLAIALSACIKDEEIKLVNEGFSPVAQSDGWTISTPESEHVDRDLLNAAYDLLYQDNRFIMARSLIVLRNGKIIAEAYPHDKGDIDRIANIQSMTKSFTSVLACMAKDQKLFTDFDETFYSIYPENFSSAGDKTDITLFHALTMQTGIKFDNGSNTQRLYETKGNSVEYVLNLPREYAPGLVFLYHDGAPQLVSPAIQKRYGAPLSDFANKYLFSPLGITDWKWEAAHDGTTFGAFSLYIKPRDAAKFGQLLLQNGRWNGKQLVDSATLSTAGSALVNSSNLGSPYGMYFWIYPAYHAIAADGHGGQRIMVFPDKNLVIVYTAWGYTSKEFWDNFNELADLISRSCN